MRSNLKTYLPDSQVAARYGVHSCTITRWERDPKLNFPKALKVNGRKYRPVAELDAFDSRREGESR